MTSVEDLKNVETSNNLIDNGFVEFSGSEVVDKITE